VFAVQAECAARDTGADERQPRPPQARHTSPGRTDERLDLR
jgi:hypothetical protein